MDKFNLKKFLTEGRINEESNETGFFFWFRAGVRANKEFENAQQLLTKEGIEFKKVGMSLKFSLDNELEEVKEFLHSNGITKYVIGHITKD